MSGEIKYSGVLSNTVEYNLAEFNSPSGRSELVLSVGSKPIGIFEISINRYGDTIISPINVRKLRIPAKQNAEAPANEVTLSDVSASNATEAFVRTDEDT